MRSLTVSGFDITDDFVLLYQSIREHAAVDTLRFTNCRITADRALHRIIEISTCVMNVHLRAVSWTNPDALDDELLRLCVTRGVNCFQLNEAYSPSAITHDGILAFLFVKTKLPMLLVLECPTRITTHLCERLIEVGSSGTKQLPYLH